MSRDKLGSFFQDLQAKNPIHIEHFSCIELSLISGLKVPRADWLFLFSPSAIRLFKEAYSFDSLKVAVLGNASKNAAEALGISVEFYSKNSDPAEVVKEFSALLKPGETVIAASSDKSLKRLETVVPPEKLIDWPFYRNRPKKNIPKSDAQYLIFTSPSNVRAYFGQHPLQTEQKVIAIGASTRQCLSALGITARAAHNPSEEGIWDAVLIEK